MARFKTVNGERVQFTAEEETARDEEEKQAVIKAQTKADREQTFLSNRTSGKAKLKAGEALNDDEISALFGD